MSITDTFDFAVEAIAHALGVSVTYTRDGFAPVTVEAVAGDGFERVQSGPVRIGSSRPEVMIRLADFPDFPMTPADARGDSVVVDGVTHEVASLRPDVEGVSATLVLKVV